MGVLDVGGCIFELVDRQPGARRSDRHVFRSARNARWCRNCRPRCLSSGQNSAAAHEAQTTADRERRITESFATAVEQLGSDKLETRLGAIYTLERIAQESVREYWPIMETLTAFVREHAPWPPRQALANPFIELQASSADETPGESTPAEKPADEVKPATSQVRPATDIQAILTVLGRRDETARRAR